MEKMVSKVDHFVRIFDKKKIISTSIKLIVKEICPRKREFQEVIEIALLLFVSFFALVKSEYMIRNEEAVSVQKILHTSDEPSTLQCFQRCKWIDKNAAILYDGEKCQCLEQSESKDTTKDSLTGLFSKPNLELGFWGKWKDKDSCSVTCGNGLMTRVRRCWAPPHIKTEVKCLKLDQKTKSDFELGTFSCNNGSCPKVDGNWGIWIAQSCQVTCGTGTRNIYRYCNNPPPSNGGSLCKKGNSPERVKAEMKTEPCQGKNDCPAKVNGGWSQWTLQGVCEVSCGEGSLSYFRYCDDPFPMYGGDECKKEDGSRGTNEERYETCYMGPCDRM